jgi:DUF4097 and DUF4098 domain-containing protein YvlB
MTPYYYQRRSVFSGLLLILIGVIFLTHEYHPEFGIGHFFNRYWPLLLILWGLAKLWDHLAASHSGEGRPPVITGGEVALIILLLAAVSGIASYDWIRHQNPDIDMDLGIGDMFEHPYDWSTELPIVPAKANEVISISTDRGNISVRPGADSQIHVIVHKTASASSEQDAQKRADEVKVEVTPTSGGYQIQPEVLGDRASRVRVDLEVQLPPNSIINAETNHGDVTIAQVNGPVAVTSKSGDVDVHDVTGDVSVAMTHGDGRINTVKGNVRVDGKGSELDLSDISGDATIDGDFYGPIRARNVAKTTRYTSTRTNLTLAKLSGRMEMDAGNLTISDLPGSLDLTTTNKDVTLENVTGRINLTDRHGNINVRFSKPPRDEVRILDESANVDLTLPAESSFDIAAVSRSGEIQNEFESPALKVTSEGDTSTLQGSYGAHGPRITLNTTYGAISIHKGQ